jgi:predicted lipid-binding transport protein (Tim44 family)
MVDERAHLAQADGHITGAKAHIAAQAQRIARLAANGHEVRDAESFLSVLRDTLKAFQRHRRAILRQLGE